MYILPMREERIRLHNRVFTSQHIQWIRNFIDSEGSQGRTHISKRLCEIWDWRTPNGQLRDITCREVLRKLEARGLIQLPTLLRRGRSRGYQNKTHLTRPMQTAAVSCALSELSHLSIDLVRGTDQECFYNALIARYHYLGYHQGSGEQLKYLVYTERRPIGCIGFASSAFKIAPRDVFIGWSDGVRRRNLTKIVNNNRFLIMPWVKVPNLASWILGAIARRIGADWLSYYNRKVVLLETFVERDRFLGTCYRAANWQYLGQTQGRGRNDRHSRRQLPVKDIYVYPLCRDFRGRLQDGEGQ